MDRLFFRLTAFILLFCQVSPGFAQSWMDGYSFRKKITVGKAKVFSETDLVDFPLLVEITDADLRHITGEYGNKMSNIQGKDLSFALSTNATVPLNFQLEAFDPGKGKLRCWVKIPLLSANSTTSAATSLYLYYGSAALHEPDATAALSTWPAGDYTRVWHMNLDTLPVASSNAATHIEAQSIKGRPGMSGANYVAGKLGIGIALDGLSDFLTSNEETSTAITLSAWIKLATTVKEQVIVCNDTVSGPNTNGYRLKINPEGNLVMELFRETLAPIKLTSVQKLTGDTWYFVSGTYSGGNPALYINGLPAGSMLSRTPRLGPGGKIRVGSSKQNTQYFAGIIDELSIENIARTAGWLKTVYANQSDPAEFYTLLAEEYNPARVFKFTGAKSSLWGTAGNWSGGIVPAPDKNIIISSGKTAQTNGKLTVDNLVLESGATLSLGNDLEVNGTAQIGPGGLIEANEGLTVKFRSDVGNNGGIRLSGLASLVFSGSSHLQKFSGSGTAEIQQLENDQGSANSILRLEAPLLITGFVKLTKGIIQPNRQLTLLASLNSTASLLSVPDEASIEGDVQVQHYISGAYPAPATGRGWRLLTSPVFTRDSGHQQYGIQHFKNSLFITGPGGATNGFDASPLNSGTVYTHDQSRPGSLSEKYVTIANAAASIPFGRGVYVFSRGSRHVADAYRKQIVNQPFYSPDGYTITHIGWVHTGDLTVQLDNRDMGTEGDGFNLLGNPYPCAIEWGRLNKSNLGPFVWLYDPINKDYMVSDASNTVIPSGAGFFVKVKRGAHSGSLIFSEGAKHLYDAHRLPASAQLIDLRQKPLIPQPEGMQHTSHTQAGSGKAQNALLPGEDPQKSKLTVGLSRGPFRQDYVVSFIIGGNGDIDDQDAVKIAEGFVSIAGIIGEHRLAVDERAQLNARTTVKLDVKGWETGSYSLDFIGSDNFTDVASVTLVDHYLDKSVKVTPLSSFYHFNINSSIPESQGAGRFELVIDPVLCGTDTLENNLSDAMVYPNPFSDKLYFKTTGHLKGIRIIIYDLWGKMITLQDISPMGQASELNIQMMQKGLYLVRVLEKDTLQEIRTFKVFKE